MSDVGQRVTTLIPQWPDLFPGMTYGDSIPVGTFGTIVADVSDEHGYLYDIDWDNGMTSGSMAFVLADGERLLRGPDAHGNYYPVEEWADSAVLVREPTCRS